jgi:hypothetical protein
MARTAQFALCVSTAVSAADVPQLRGRQLTSQVENCYNDVCHNHGYTGYNHKNSGTPESQWELDIDEGVNEWWRCAENCPEEDCDGWTFAYKGDGGPYKCYLKKGVKPHPEWSYDENVISGLVKQTIQTNTTLGSDNCAKVCEHDNCKGTATNPIPEGEQWKDKGVVMNEGLCCFLAMTGHCHKSCRS